MNKDNSLTETIKALVRGRGLKRVIVTGYSLGAATAALYLISAGDELQQAGIDIRCVTFGCPRFVESHDVDKLPFHLTSRIMNTYVEGDPIPLGLTSMLGLTDYRHIGYSMVIDKCGERFRLHDGDGTRGHDEVIKWWGLKTPQAHLSENYDQKLKTIEDTLLKNKFRTFGVNAVRMTRV